MKIKARQVNDVDAEYHYLYAYVIDQGHVFRRVGLLWIDEGPADDADRECYPEVEN